jgi:pimeloyl-ACP methyl ester carboxylesterase
MNAPVETIVPFYFGTDDERLFGNFQSPAAGAKHRSVVLICNPLGIEYPYTHRTYRQLAIRLNRIGFDVMRFDYYGSGDSAGSDEDGTLSRWRENIETAINEAKRRSGRASVCLAGLRLGASLAAQVAINRQDVTGLVLWEPVVNGPEYLAEIQDAHQRRLWYLPTPPEPKPDGRISEILGYGLSETLVDEIQHLDLLALSQKPADQIFVTDRTVLPAIQQFNSLLERLGARVNYQQLDGPTIWAENPDKALVPNQILQGMVAWMGEALA